MYYKPEIVYRRDEIEGEEVTILKETGEYALVEGSGELEGNFSILRKVDSNVTDWVGGDEGKKIAIKMRVLSTRKFNDACKAEFDAAA